MPKVNYLTKIIFDFKISIFGYLFNVLLLLKIKRNIMSEEKKSKEKTYELRDTTISTLRDTLEEAKNHEYSICKKLSETLSLYGYDEPPFEEEEILLNKAFDICQKKIFIQNMRNRLKSIVQNDEKAYFAKREIARLYLNGGEILKKKLTYCFQLLANAIGELSSRNTGAIRDFGECLIESGDINTGSIFLLYNFINNENIESLIYLGKYYIDNPQHNNIDRGMQFLEYAYFYIQLRIEDSYPEKDFSEYYFYLKNLEKDLFEYFKNCSEKNIGKFPEKYDEQLKEGKLEIDSKILDQKIFPDRIDILTKELKGYLLQYSREDKNISDILQDIDIRIKECEEKISRELLSMPDAFEKEFSKEGDIIVKLKELIEIQTIKEYIISALNKKTPKCILKAAEYYFKLFKRVDEKYLDLMMAYAELNPNPKEKVNVCFYILDNTNMSDIKAKCNELLKNIEVSEEQPNDYIAVNKLIGFGYIKRENIKDGIGYLLKAAELGDINAIEYIYLMPDAERETYGIDMTALDLEAAYPVLIEKFNHYTPPANTEYPVSTLTESAEVKEEKKDEEKKEKKDEEKEEKRDKVEEEKRDEGVEIQY